MSRSLRRSHGVGSPYGRRASFVRRGQWHWATNGHRRRAKSARVPPCCPRPPWQSDNVRSCRFTHRWRRPEPERAHAAAATSSSSPGEYVHRDQAGKMLRLRSSQRGRTDGRSGAWYRHRHRRRRRRQHRARARVGSPAQRGVAQVGVRVPPLRPSLRRRRSLDSLAT